MHNSELTQKVTQLSSHEPENCPHTMQLRAENAVFLLAHFLNHRDAVIGFKSEVGNLGIELVKIISNELLINLPFKRAFDEFSQLCRNTINPNLAQAVILEMLVQHLLTERLFRTVFDNSECRKKNTIAQEIEKVMTKLMAASFSREQCLNRLDHLYVAIERAAATIEEYSCKQEFLNTIYEKFFQGFAIKVADTNGIVYTPQPIVEFMVNSVEEILKKEFNCSLSSLGVHILDPFVGTGNFLVHVLRKIELLQLNQKYQSELHCNEVMLLPYYIASMNIEHAFYERTGKYQPFEGIRLVDTFGVAEDHQTGLFLPQAEHQQAAKLVVILGNPPYNAWQQNGNDNNKNRKYEWIDELIRESYAKNSKAMNKNALFDPYVKAFVLATETLKRQSEGVIAFVTNNSFLDNVAFDGMRKQLAKDFSKIYLLNLGGNVRKNPKLSGTVHNVFGIQVGVCITLLIKKANSPPSAGATIYYYSTEESWRKEQKYNILTEYEHYGRVTWQLIQPDQNHTWLTEGLRTEFKNFIPLGTRVGKASKKEVEGIIFKTYSGGVKTNRDAWTYHFNRETLISNMRRTIEAYNEQVLKWSNIEKPDDQQECSQLLDSFVSYDDTKISWDSTLKLDLSKGLCAEFSLDKIRNALYRPFTKSHLFLDRRFNNSVYRFPKIFPTPDKERENRVLCVSAVGSNQIFQCLMTNMIPDMHLTGDSQCFPFYTYAKDGTHRQENLTDWALKAFCQHYDYCKLNKWDIFYYVYGLLHHPDYRKKYAINLKRELPRIPYAADFWAFANAGRQLADLHVHYDTQPEYPLTLTCSQRVTDWRVTKMKLSKDKTSIIYNETLILNGIPPETFEYRLGNRSALEWVIAQHQITQDKRSGIINNPNRLAEAEYILRLIKRVVTVSINTVDIVKKLPTFA